MNTGHLISNFLKHYLRSPIITNDDELTSFLDLYLCAQLVFIPALPELVPSIFVPRFSEMACHSLLPRVERLIGPKILSCLHS